VMIEKRSVSWRGILRNNSSRTVFTKFVNHHAVEADQNTKFMSCCVPQLLHRGSAFERRCGGLELWKQSCMRRSTNGCFQLDNQPPIGCGDGSVERSERGRKGKARYSARRA